MIVRTRQIIKYMLHNVKLTWLTYVESFVKTKVQEKIQYFHRTIVKVELSHFWHSGGYCRINYLPLLYEK